LPKFVTCFIDACKNVEPTKGDTDNAPAAHKDVRAVLEEDDRLSAMGIETVLIGSYKRQTAIRRVKDVDVFSRLPQFDESLSAEALLAEFDRVLRAAYSARVTQQDRSFKIEFDDFDLTVDAVPARPDGLYWQIPTADGEWQATNPEALTTLSSAMNTRYDDRYIPVVKLVRQTRRNVLGESKPGGFLFEILCYHSFDAGLSGSDLGTLYTNALRAIADRLRARVNGIDIADPTLPGTWISVRASDAEWEAAADEFEALAANSSTAIDPDADECAAAKAFRDMLGKNSAGNWVFPMPAACNDDGSTKTPIVASVGSSTAPRGSGGFA
jgi:hypothetical protein